METPKEDKTAEVRDIRDIIWDGDNTIWNWVKYAAKAYQGTADLIAAETGIPEPAVVKAMKQFYTEVGTLEHAGLIQGLQTLGLFKKVENFDKNALIQKVREVFKTARKDYLRNYRGVLASMRKAHEKGINNIIVTDAPRFHAERRVVRAKIAPYVKRVHAIRPRIISDLPEDVQKKIREGRYQEDIPFEVFEMDVEKPDTNLETVVKIMSETSDRVKKYIRDHVAIVGDNDRKDMELARRNECLGVLAAWGAPDPEDLKIIKKFAPDQVTRRNMSLAQIQKKAANDSSIIVAKRPEDLDQIFQLDMTA